MWEGSNIIFLYAHLGNLAQVYHVNYLYIIHVIYVWDIGDTVASQSVLAISYIKAHGTQCPEENAGKYDRNDICIAVFIGSTWRHSVLSPPFLCPSHSCATCQSMVTAATTTKRKVNKIPPEGSQSYSMHGICCAVTTFIRKTTILFDPKEIISAE